MPKQIDITTPSDNQIKILERLIGADQPCFIIAEAGVNHNGDMNLAHKLIDAAIAAGADAIKFQSFIAEDLVTAGTPKANYQVETTGTDDGQFGMLKALELSAGQQAEIKGHCDEGGIIYLCTPYEEKSADMLDRLDVAAYKVASTDTNNIPFLRYLAAKGRPVILSTGMSDEEEVENSMVALEAAKGKTAILHCTSEYPAPPEESNLRAIRRLREKYQCPVGYSDHTAGIGVSPYAIAAGASILEKHFTLDVDLPGPDHRASIIPEELTELVNMVRMVEKVMGDGVKIPMTSELKNKNKMQKSIVADRDIEAGHIFQAQDLVIKRPGTGLAPKLLDELIGKKSAVDISRDSVLQDSDVIWPDKS